MKTLKTAELPHTIYITFKGDNEITMLKLLK